MKTNDQYFCFQNFNGDGNVLINTNAIIAAIFDYKDPYHKDPVTAIVLETGDKFKVLGTTEEIAAVVWEPSIFDSAVDYSEGMQDVNKKITAAGTDW